MDFHVSLPKCSSDNKSETVLDYFLDAVQRLGLPSRVRCDRGVENRSVSKRHWKGLLSDVVSITKGLSVRGEMFLLVLYLFTEISSFIWKVLASWIQPMNCIYFAFISYTIQGLMMLL